MEPSLAREPTAAEQLLSASRFRTLSTRGDNLGLAIRINGNVTDAQRKLADLRLRISLTFWKLPVPFVQVISERRSFGASDKNMRSEKRPDGGTLRVSERSGLMQRLDRGK